MKPALAVLLVALAATLSFAAPAAAGRAPTGEEAVGLFTGVGSLYSVCGEVAVSTVDANWGAFVAADDDDACLDGTYVLMVRGADGRWRTMGYGAGREACVDGFPLAPEAVAVDLTGCHRSSLRRVLSRDELDALAGSLYGGRLDASCYTARVSLRDERFAFGYLPDNDRCGSGSFFASRADGAWRIAAEYAMGDPVMCRTPGVPEPVVRSLYEECVVPRPALVCVPGTDAALRVRPRTCITNSGGYAQSRWLVGVRWTDWGGPRARGVGWSRHFRARASDRHLRVRIEAFGLSTRYCGPARPVYTKLRIRYARNVISVGGARFRIPAGSTTVKIGEPAYC